MQAIFYKIGLDVRTHKLQHLSLVVLVALSSFLVSLALLSIFNANAPYTRLFQQLHGAHAWAFVSGTNEPSSALAVIAKNTATTEVSDPFPAISTGVLVTGTKQQVLVVGMPAQQPVMGQLLLLKGQYLTPTIPHGIVIDDPFASEYNLKVGDMLQMVTSSGPVALPIVGLSTDVNHGALGISAPHVYVLEDQFFTLFARSTQQVTLIGIRIANPAAVQTYLSQLATQLSTTGATFSFLDTWTIVRDSYTQYFHLEMIFFLSFGFLALGVSGFVIVNLITGLVLAERRDIGILKALGFTPGQIIALYLFVYTASALGASLLGVVVSLFVAPMALRQAASALYTTPVTSYDPLLLGLIVLGMTAVVAIFAFFPAWRAGQIPPVSAIRGTSHVASRLSARLAILAEKVHLSEVWVLGIGQSFARPWRACLTTLSFLALVCTTIFTIGIYSTIDTYSTPQAQGIYSSVLITPGLSSVDAVRSLLSSQQGILYYTYLIGNLSIKHTSSHLPLQFLDGDTSPIKQNLVQGRWYHENANEIVMPISTLDSLNLHLGETIELENPFSLRVHIIGVYSARYAGAPGLVSLGLFPSTLLSKVQNSSTFAVTLPTNTNPTLWNRTILTESAGRLNVFVENPHPPAQIEELKIAMFLPLGILTLIAVVSVLNAMLLTIRERFREFGILKALGMTPRNITMIVQIGAASYVILACVLGYPLGMLLTAQIFRMTASAIGFSIEQTSFNAFWLCCIFPLMLFFAWLGCYLPGQWAAQAVVANILRME